RVGIGTNINARTRRVGRIKSRLTYIREIASAFRNCRNGRVERGTCSQAETFIAEKGKSPVLDDRSANGCAELILSERRGLVRLATGNFIPLVEELVGVENLISQIFVAGAMPGIRS